MWRKISLSVLHYIQGPMKNKWNILLVLAEHWSRTCTTWMAFNLTAQMSRLGDAQLATPVSFMLHNHSLIHSCVVTSWVVTSNLIHACVQHGPLMWPLSLSLCWYAHAQCSLPQLPPPLQPPLYVLYLFSIVWLRFMCSKGGLVI